VIAPTTPTGSSTTVELPICSSQATLVVSPAAVAMSMTGRPACTVCDSFVGAPISAEIVSATTPIRAASASCNRDRYFARSSGLVAAHPSKAARAAATARSTSAAVPEGTRPMISSVAGFSISITSVPDDATHWPSM